MEHPTPRIYLLLERLSVLSRELSVQLDLLARHFASSDKPDKRLPDPKRRRTKAYKLEIKDAIINWSDTDVE